MKKIVSLILALIMISGTAASLAGTVAATDMPGYQSDVYVASYLAGTYRGVNWDPGVDPVQRIQMLWYADPANCSPAKIMADAMQQDAGFMNSLALWKVATFDGNDGTLDRVGYCEAVVLNVVNYEMTSSNTASELEQSGVVFVSSLESGLLDLLDKLEGTDVNTVLKTNVGDLTPELTESIKGLASGACVNIGDAAKVASFIDDLIGLGVTVENCFKTVAKVEQLAKLGNDVRGVLEKMYDACSAGAMKTALYEVYQLCGNEFDIYLNNALRVVSSVYYYGYKKVMEEMWKQCLSSLGAFGAGAAIGQVIGKGLANFLFSTDATLEKYYVITALRDFEDLLYGCLPSYEEAFRNTGTEYYAKVYLRAIEMLFSCKKLGCDWAIEFADIVYQGALITNFLNSAEDVIEYKAFLRSVNSIKNTLGTVETGLLNPDSYKPYLEMDYPDNYKEIYNVTPSSTSRVPTEKRLIVNTPSSSSYGKSYLLKYDKGTNGIVIKGVESLYPFDLEIPAAINGGRVTEIAAEAFDGNTLLKSVRMYAPMNTIGLYAFRNCSSLSEIVLPESVVTLGQSFIEGTSVETLTVPKNVTSTTVAIRGCNTLKTLIFEEGMTAIPDNIASSSDGTRLSSVTIPSTVKTIGKRSFYNCRALTSVDIPKSVSYIDESAFASCTSLERVTFNYNDEMIDLGGNVIKPFSLQIGAQAFENCGKLTEVGLTENVTSIGLYAFRNCSSLSGIVLPESVVTLGQSFIEGTSVETLTVPKNVTSTTVAIRGCNTLKALIFEEGMTAIPDNIANSGSIMTVTIPSSVVRIGNSAFYKCSSLEAVFYGGTSEDEWLAVTKGTNNDPLNSATVVYHTHDFEVVSVTPPTCTESGSTVFVCAGCGVTYVGDITDPVGHSVVVIPGKAPTCTEDGLTEGSYCSVCGEVFAEQTVAPATGHDSVSRVSKRATCETDGEITYVCRICHETYTEIIPATGHDYSIVGETVPATCSAEGYTVFYCVNCGDAYCSFVPMTDHTYSDTVVPPTCTAVGYTEHVCTGCGDSYRSDFTAPAGHSWDEGIQTVPPTTESEGVKTYTCVRCGTIRTEAIPKLDGHGHIPGDINGDGTVNSKDLTRLLKYVSGEPVTVNEAALDVNGDGNVNSKDLTRLLKYVSGENVEVF